MRLNLKVIKIIVIVPKGSETRHLWVIMLSFDYHLVVGGSY